MQVNIANLGDNPVRVIVDHEADDDAQLGPGEDQQFETADGGVIELGDVAGADEGAEGAAQAEPEGVPP
ncbi:hypothetical protein OKW45_001979 [Paraburkholderia sp. WSM4175]|uniref:hypothetical protein n=1 Tax=Paraburkholderia sp. WSM4175 TaxID=2991072 RepID=UPI003D2531E4